VTHGDGLIVITTMEMPDWDVRQHRATLIRFEGKTWRVASKTASAGKIHYHLTRWDPHDHDVAGREINYSAEYVALRGQAARSIRGPSRLTGIFRILSPFVGFLPARTKDRLEIKYGIDPVATTFQSVFLEFLITLGSFVWALIGTMVAAHAGGVTFWDTYPVLGHHRRHRRRRLRHALRPHPQRGASAARLLRVAREAPALAPPMTRCRGFVKAA
jgi:hypothetical protein